MPNEILLKVGTQIVFANHAGDFAPAAANDLQQGTPTEVEWAPASLASASYHQSAKADLGATRAMAYELMAAIEFAATPTAGNVVEFFWGSSPDGTAANGNPGGLSGSDGAYTGYSSNALDSVRQLDRIGTFVVTAQATGTVQIAKCGVLVPDNRYGMLVVRNGSGAAFHSDDVEIHAVLTPIVTEVQ